MIFAEMTLEERDVGPGRLRVRHGGKGPPLLLLHGNPQTHWMWEHVAPPVAQRFHVICPDLRGYGGSFKPPATSDHAPYAKRAMAADMIALMAGFGYSRFRLVGHDRGARVAHRLALDHAEAVEKLALLDIIPTLEHFERTDMRFALAYYHWFWFAQPHPFPENLITAAPETWFYAHVGRGATRPPPFFSKAALEDYLAAIRQPEAIIGMCEDYRAAASIDLDHDRESRARGEKIRAPLLVLWGARNILDRLYDVLAIWRAYAAGPVEGRALPCGHYLPEEAPAEVLAALDAFL
jgi:haloacetate dehalogenase